MKKITLSDLLTSRRKMRFLMLCCLVLLVAFAGQIMITKNPKQTKAVEKISSFVIGSEFNTVDLIDIDQSLYRPMVKDSIFTGIACYRKLGNVCDPFQKNSVKYRIYKRMFDDSHYFLYV